MRNNRKFMEASVDAKELYMDSSVKLVKFFIKRNVYGVKYFDSVEDFEQELLLKLWEALPLYSLEKGKFSTYAYTCCKNCLLIKIRLSKAKKRDGVTVSLDEEIGEGYSLRDSIEGETDIYEDFVLEDFLQKAIPFLKKETHLFLINELKLTEISELTGLKKTTVAARIRRNILQIKKYLLEGVLPEKRTCEQEAKRLGISLSTYFRRKAKENKNGK